MSQVKTVSSRVPSYRLYRERSGESGAFWIHCETIPARTELHNWEIAPHRHDALFQLFHVTAGEGELTGDAAARRFQAPCAIYIPPRAIHGFRFSRDVDGLVVTAIADRLDAPGGTDRGIAGFLSRLRIVDLSGSRQDAAVCGEAVALIHRELAARRPGQDLLLDSLITAALITLARADRAEDGDAAGGRDRERLRALETLVATHFREQPPIAFFAGRMGMSAGHLNRLARKHFGTSMADLVARRIIETARRDLIFTPTPVQAIAYSLGFSDPAYFNRFFRRHAGTTPGAFREEQRRSMASA